MDSLKTFFTVNDVIVQFVHGQVFLVLGVVMLLQWRQRSQLELARALPWLAAFGLFEAVATWGNSFIPVQATLLDASLITQLRYMQLLVHLATFIALLGFGLMLHEPIVSRQVARLAPGVVFAAFAMPLTAWQMMQTGDTARYAAIESAMRYFIAAPAALLVAAGLRRQAGRLVGAYAIPRVIASLRIAGMGFVIYAIVEGALAPVLPVFPANALNDQTIFNLIGVPVGILRALGGAVIAVFFFSALEVFRIEAERIAQELQRVRSLNDERERISRDLHDGTIQSIYAAGLALDGVRQAVDEVTAAPDVPLRVSEELGNARVQLDQVMTALNKTIQGIRSYIYDLRATAGDEDLTRGLVQIVAEFRNRTGLTTHWQAEGNASIALTAEQRQHLYLIVREALSNIQRHADASEARITLRYDPGALRIRIGDNGTGDLPDEGQLGRGLRNMRERAQLLGARLEIASEAGAGTTVIVELSDAKDQIAAGG